MEKHKRVTEQLMVETKPLMSANLKEWTIIHFVSSVNMYFDCISGTKGLQKTFFLPMSMFFLKFDTKSEQVKKEESSMLY